MDEQDKEEGIDRLKFILEQQRFAFEQEKWRAEFDLRRRELELKEVEDRHRRGFLRRLDPVSVGIFTATLVLIGNLITTSMQNSAKLEADKITHSRQLDLERERFEADLIKDYIKTKPERVEENLRFLIASGLVRLKASQLQTTLTEGPKPSLTATTQTTPRDSEREACFFGTDWERSEQACTALLREHISDPRDEVAIRKRIGYVLNELKSYERAIEVLTEALKLNSQDTEVYNHRGFAYRNQEQYALALADFDKALELNPKYAFAYNNRGLVHYDQEQYALALADFDKALELDPKYVAAYSNRGRAYRNQEQYALALADFNKALELNPKFIHAYNNRGLVYSRQRQYTLALADFNKALELNPEYAIAYNNRGFLYRQKALVHRDKGLVDQAMADFNKAIKFDPKNPAGWRNRALSRGLAGDLAGAQQDLAEALHLRPIDARTTYISGVLKELAGNATDAMRDFANARQMTKSDWEWKWIVKDPRRKRAYTQHSCKNYR